VFEGQAVPAGLFEDAHARGAQSHPIAGSRFEGLDEHLSHIVLDPFIEDLDQKTAKLLRAHGAIGDGTAHLVDVESIRIDAFDDRDELNPLGANLIPQEAVYLTGMVTGDPVDGDQDVVFNFVLLQEPQPAHHFVISWSTTLINAVDIMHVTGTVQAQPDQVVIFLEELAPFVVQQRAVGLHGVLESHARYPVLLLELDRLAVEIHPHQGWFATLPGNSHFGTAMALDQLLDIGFQSLFRHAELAVRVEQLLIQEEAV